MENKSIAFVVAHPAHILTVAGMVQRYKPHILVCNSSESSNAGNQAKLVRAGLKLLGIQESPTFLDIDEPEAYGWAHDGNWSPFIEIRNRIFDWIEEKSPDVVFGDAYECANYQHDVMRLLLDSALRQFRDVGSEVRNYEFPLVCKTVGQPDTVQFQMFPSGNIQRFQLTDDEIQRKEAIIRWAWPQSDFIAEVAPLFPPINVEPYREIPWDRDYSKVSEGLLNHYNGRGHELVAKGVHTKPILFDQHFLPLVDALYMSNKHSTNRA